MPQRFWGEIVHKKMMKFKVNILLIISKITMEPLVYIQRVFPIP